MHIAHNLSAWLLGMAKSKGIDAIGLVSEIPAYKPEDRNIRAWFGKAVSGETSHWMLDNKEVQK